MAKKQEEMDLEKAAKTAEEELDALEKSLTGDEDKEETDVDQLEKAIDETDEVLEDLSKSDDEEKEEEDEEKEEMEKSEDDDIADELVKASEAYAELEKSVAELETSLTGKVETLTKAVASLTSLSVRQAKVITALTKSLQDQGGKPMKKSQAHLGGGDGEPQPLAKSRSEIRGILLKAVEEKKEDARILSMFDSYGGNVERIAPFVNDETRAAIGIK